MRSITKMKYKRNRAFNEARDMEVSVERIYDSVDFLQTVADLFDRLLNSKWELEQLYDLAVDFSKTNVDALSWDEVAHYLDEILVSMESVDMKDLYELTNEVAEEMLAIAKKIEKRR